MGGRSSRYKSSYSTNTSTNTNTNTNTNTSTNTNSGTEDTVIELNKENCKKIYEKFIEYNNDWTKLNEDQFKKMFSFYKFIYENCEEYKTKLLNDNIQFPLDINLSDTDCNEPYNHRIILTMIEYRINSGQINRDNLDKNIYLNKLYTDSIATEKKCFPDSNSENSYYNPKRVHNQYNIKRDTDGKAINQGFVDSTKNYVSSLLNFSDTSTNTSVSSITSATGTDVNAIAETLAPIARAKLPSLPDFSWVIDNLGIILIIIIIIYGIFLIIRLWTSRKIPNLILMFIIFVIVCLLYMAIGSMFTQLMFILGDFFARVFFPNIVLNKNQDMLFWDNIWYVLLITYILLIITTIIRSVKEEKIHASSIIWSLAILFILFIYTIIYWFVFAYDNIENIFYIFSITLFWITIAILLLRYFLPLLVQYIYIFYAIGCYLYIVCFFIYFYKVLNYLYDKYL
jgi:hypothetical protein